MELASELELGMELELEFEDNSILVDSSAEMVTSDSWTKSLMILDWIRTDPDFFILFSGLLGAAMGLTEPLELVEQEPAELLLLPPICNFSGLAGTGGLPEGGLFLTLMEGLGVPFRIVVEAARPTT